MWRSSLLLACLCIVAARPALGQSDDKKDEDKVFKFKTDDSAKPEFDGGLKFKTDDAPSSAAAATESTSQNVFKIPVGYPKKEMLFSYNPGFNGFKNELANTRTYNYGGGSPVNVSLGFRYSFSAEDFFTISANIQTAKVPHFDDTAAGLSIKDSSVQLWSLQLQGNFYCTFYDSVNHKFCPGYQVTLDNFPSLEIPTNSNFELELTGVRDMTLGLGALYTKPFIGETVLLSRAFFDYGFGVGQSSNLGTKSNQHLSGQAGLEWPLEGRETYLSLMGGVDYRRAVMKSIQDEWNITNIQFLAMLGARWEIGR